MILDERFVANFFFYDGGSLRSDDRSDSKARLGARKPKIMNLTSTVKTDPCFKGKRGEGSPSKSGAMKSHYFPYKIAPLISFSGAIV